MLLTSFQDPFEVGAQRQPELEPGQGPVAGAVGQGLDLAERQGVQHAALVAQLERRSRDAFHRAADGADLDIVADPEAVLQQEEDTGQDVGDGRLGLQADGDAHNAGAGDQRPDLDAHGRQDDRDDHDHQSNAHEVPEQRQQGSQPLGAAEIVVGIGEFEPAIHPSLEQGPADIAEQDDDGDVEEHTEPVIGKPGLLRVEAPQIRDADEAEDAQGESLHGPHEIRM